MKVIAKKNTARLVKGMEYDVVKLSNSNSQRKSIYIKVGKVNYFTTPNNFTLSDGSDIPQRDWVSPEYTNQIDVNKSTTINDVRALKNGDIVVCKYPTKCFDKDKMYRIIDILYTEKKSKYYSGNTRTVVEQKIKIEGYNKWINPYRFRTCTPQEKREISLRGLFEEEVNIDTDYRSMRKIDRYDEKDRKKIILSCLINSIFDDTRHLSILDWAVEKKGKKYDIEAKDIKPLLSKKLCDIIKELDGI